MGFLFLMNQAYINLYQFSPLLFFKYEVLEPSYSAVRLKYSWNIDIRLTEDRKWIIKLTTAFNYF